MSFGSSTRNMPVVGFFAQPIRLAQRRVRGNGDRKVAGHGLPRMKSHSGRSILVVSGSGDRNWRLNGDGLVNLKCFAGHHFSLGNGRDNRQAETILQNFVEQLPFYFHQRTVRQRQQILPQLEQRLHARRRIVRVELRYDFVRLFADLRAAGDARPGQVNAIHQIGAGRAGEQSEAGCEIAVATATAAPAETADVPGSCAGRWCERRWPAWFHR